MPGYRKKIYQLKLLIYLLAGGCTVVIYSQTAVQVPFFEHLPGDLPQYFSRFFLSFILLGIIPFCITLLYKEGIVNLGFRRPESFFRPPLFFFLAGAAILGGYASSFSPEISSFYPYSSTLVSLYRDRGLGLFFLHAGMYFLLYYVPWEFFFRGFLIFPFVRALSPEYDYSKRVTPAMAAIASFQIIPSALLHFGHPLSESLGAVFFGLFAAWFALKTRSIWPGLVFHALMGISLDFFLFLRTG